VRSRYSIEEKSHNLFGAWFREGGMQKTYLGIYKIVKHNGERLSHFFALFLLQEGLLFKHCSNNVVRVWGIHMTPSGNAKYHRE